MTRCPAAMIAVALPIGLAWVNTSARQVLLAADRGRTGGRESLVRPRRLRRRSARRNCPVAFRTAPGRQRPGGTTSRCAGRSGFPCSSRARRLIGGRLSRNWPMARRFATWEAVMGALEPLAAQPGSAAMRPRSVGTISCHSSCRSRSRPVIPPRRPPSRRLRPRSPNRTPGRFAGRCGLAKRDKSAA